MHQFDVRGHKNYLAEIIQAEIIAVELEYPPYLAFNYWHSFKIYSLTDTLMHRPQNLEELGSVLYQNTQFCSL